ncbi:SDR family oxidoreductase [Rhizobium ruizarguesonis]|uniref:SDR family oxidoreductase n=1 Tax=Rhizobium ruizarguesonis TaxID=2081791 RepID=A0ABY1X5K7_9HYPH|nr:SDR family NAD(P)-dependent oxidoreductase [Rhizobium ruizarguesonis]TAU75429.1 SDR family oxidoreductase [Rhizobium ruizarguesonis]TAV31768.1 SDR family oxidoreductase [Rhizobium ruizarguesonis]TAV36532.1 SDR family oxidoreductase [Rhizobium ruizarguesonis]TAW63702.1 SDR family oxidoreductase [Rhizobium ruizarguesonis]TAX80497.1 SDR family oxidoreductase [Rhizobium ruizarguesonis]
MDLHLTGKKALVTGSTRGIGLAIAERLALEGADVAICARSGDAVEDVVKALESKGGKAWGRSVDVKDPAALRSWVESAAAALGGVDILVANASALSFGLSIEAFQSAFDVDLIHTVTAVEAVMPHLERSRAGSIVAIGSIGGVEDSELNAYTEVSYGAIKAPLHFYIKSLARTVAPKGIRANVVSPGSTFFDGGAWDQIKSEQPEHFRNAVAMIPMGRMARPEEIANVVAFTASPAASYITGANLVVDGAFTRRI